MSGTREASVSGGESMVMAVGVPGRRVSKWQSCLSSAGSPTNATAL